MLNSFVRVDRKLPSSRLVATWWVLVPLWGNSMPLYVYEVVNEDGSEGEQFEIFQSMSESALTKHPETGKPIRRVFQAPAVGGKWSESAMNKSVADDKKLDRLGFTKYVKSGDGTYEKRAGKGPDVISADKPFSAD